MSEQSLPNLADVAKESGARSLLGSLKERFHKPLAETLTAAKSEASQRLQGQELMQVVSARWSTEQTAAANADKKKEEVGNNRASTRREIITQAKVMTKLALGGDISKLTVDEISVIKGESGDWRAPAQTWMENLTKMQTELKALQEARGALPNESLKVEQASIDGIELAEAHEILDGGRVLEILNTDGAVDDLDQLSKAVNISESMERARKNGSHNLNKLHDRLLLRYPDQAGEIDSKFNSLSGEREASLSSFELHTETGELTPESVNERVKQLLDTANLQRTENRNSLLNSLGIEMEEEGSYKLAENSPLSVLLNDESLLELQTQDLEQALQKAENDPRLADAALTIALTRHTTNELSRLTSGQIDQLVQETRIKESIQIAEEKAAAERSATWNKVKGFAAKIGLRASKVANTVAGGIAKGLGKTVQGVGMVAAAPGLLTAKAGEFFADRAELNRNWASGGLSGAESKSSERTGLKAEQLQAQIKKLTAELNALNNNQ